MRGVKEVISRFRYFTQPTGAIQAVGIIYWRERIYYYMVSTLLVVGFLALIPSVWLSFQTGLYGLGVFDILAYALLIGLLFMGTAPYELRVLLLLLLGFSIGVVVFFATGDEGAGMFWMAAIPPMASLLLGLRWGAYFLTLNAFFLFGAGYLIAQGSPATPGLTEFDLLGWVVFSINFLVTNAIITVPMGALLDGLLFSAEQEARAKDFAERVIETSNAIFLHLDTAGRVIRINATAEQITGYSRAEVEGQSWFDLIVPKEKYPHVIDEFGRITTMEDAPDIVENPVLTKLGEERHVLWKNAKLVENGRVVGVISFGIDITDRRQAEESLQRAYRELYQTRQLNEIVLSSSTVGILAYEVDTGRCVLANQAARNLVGAMGDELLSQNFREIQSWKDSGMLEAAEQTIASRQIHEIDTKMVTSFDKIAHMHCSFGSFTMGDKQHLLLSISDIGEISRAKEEMASRLNELNAIHQLSSALRAANRMEEMADLLLATLLDVFQLSAGSIWMHDETRDEVRVVSSRGYTNERGEEVPIPPEKPGQGLAGMVFAMNESFVSDDMHTDPRIPPQVHALVPPGVGGATLPIRAEDKVIGVISVNTLLPQRAQDLDINLLTTLADIAGNAIQRHSLYQQTERGLQRLMTLRSIDRAIVSNFALLPTLDVLLEHVVARLGVDASLVMLFNPDTKTLESVATYGFKTDAFENRILQFGEGNAGKAAAELRTVYIEDLQTQKDNPRLGKALAKENFVTYLGVPLVARDKVKGVLEVFHRQKIEPEPEWLDFLETLAGQAAIAIDNAQLFEDLEKSNTNLALAYDAAIEGWSRALDLRDKETEGHTLRVTELTIQLALKMGVDEEGLIHMRRGSLLHDIGKMGVPDSILLKPDALSPEEWVIMHKHPVFARDMLMPMIDLHQALDIPFAHHEKWDGSGYPRGLKGEEIPLAARIFAVADVYDALTSDRPYRKAWTKKATLKYIRDQSGKHFEPRVVEEFLDLIKNSD